MREFPPDFQKMFISCKSKKIPTEIEKCQLKVRDEYRNFESGRYWHMASDIHKFVSHLYSKDLRDLKKKYPELVKIANEFGTIEELRKF